MELVFGGYINATFNNRNIIRMTLFLVTVLKRFILSSLFIIHGSFSDNFYNSDGKDCNCVPLILQKNNKFKLK
jgi:hypothetical protein